MAFILWYKYARRHRTTAFGNLNALVVERGGLGDVHSRCSRNTFLCFIKYLRPIGKSSLKRTGKKTFFIFSEANPVFYHSYPTLPRVHDSRHTQLSYPTLIPNSHTQLSYPTLPRVHDSRHSHTRIADTGSFPTFRDSLHSKNGSRVRFDWTERLMSIHVAM